MWPFKKKEPVVKPYKDISSLEMFNELREKMKIISSSEDTVLTDAVVDAKMLIICTTNLGILLDRNNFSIPLLKLNDWYFLESEANESEKEWPRVFKYGPNDGGYMGDHFYDFIAGHRLLGNIKIDTNIREVYAEFKELEKEFPDALTLLFKLQ